MNIIDEFDIDGSAEEVVKMQDEFLDYLSESKFAEAFSDHIENIDLRQTVYQYSEQEKENKKILAQSWQEFNSYTSDFFSSYRISKELLCNEIQRARETQCYNKKRLEDLIFDITDSTDFFIVKAVNLFIALFVAIGNAQFENHIEKLQEANRQLKVQAKTVMQQSNDVSSVLKTKQLYDIEHSLKAYEIALENAEIFIKEKMKALDIVIDDLEK